MSQRDRTDGHGWPGFFEKAAVENNPVSVDRSIMARKRSLDLCKSRFPIGVRLVPSNSFASAGFDRFIASLGLGVILVRCRGGYHLKHIEAQKPARLAQVQSKNNAGTPKGDPKLQDIPFNFPGFLQRALQATQLANREIGQSILDDRPSDRIKSH